MRLFGETEKDYFELTRISGATDSILLRAILVLGGETKIDREISMSVTQIHETAAWLENLWNDVAPAVLGESGIQFVYSHREHVGEGFFYVVVDGKNQLLVYEQLGQSNVVHAQEFSELLPSQ